MAIGAGLVAVSRGYRRQVTDEAWKESRAGGDSGGTVVLWELGTKKFPASGHALKFPISRLRIAPTAAPDAPCG
ncbi:hypothetical protein OG819_07195 [Streptomyces sp. NBC_01549]|uniref:hypothetical protein n=1 Tax=Streptomyces sp. NBC_01549 TaxID=2975874 RepID=UPI00224CFC07|nr:hypothetical protein [Streptomyces sp. NBC_01549]MCX4589543.1 hypothetical protein [Streptomyces sp. NBC_01549]